MSFDDFLLDDPAPTTTAQHDLDELLANFPGFRTGSREICSPAPICTDEDWLILVPEHTDTTNMLPGWQLGGSADTSDGHPSTLINGFWSYRRDHLNVIFTKSSEFYRRFAGGTRLAKRLNISNKADRIALFSACLYGAFN